MHRYLTALFLSVWGFMAAAQIGGRGVYNVLNLSPSARTAALGGTVLGIYDRDVNLGFQNPAMINKNMHGQLGMNYLKLFADINQGYFTYAHHVDSVGTFTAGIMYLNYGQFTATDYTGAITGSFTGSDVAFQFGYGNKKGMWSYGANLKIIYSQLEIYKSLGVATDIAGAYVNEKKLVNATLVFKNIGTQITKYANTYEYLPFEIQAGYSQKLRYAPFRFSVVAHNLQTPDISYINTNNRDQQIDFSTNKPVEQKVSTGDKIFRHFIIATELVFGKNKNFNVRLGYNHQKRMEMSLPDARGFTGFSWGFSLKLLRMNVSYASAGFFPGRNTNQFSLLIDTQEIFKKKSKKPATEAAPAEPEAPAEKSK